jgi:preprotein translocase subunit YajC
MEGTHMLWILAQGADAGTQPSPLAPFLFLVPMALIFYFLLIRPQNQRRRAQMQLQAEIEAGDEVITTGGIYGTITDIDDDFGIVTLEIAPNTEIRIARAAIVQRLADEEERVDEDEEVEGAEPGS